MSHFEEFQAQAKAEKNDRGAVILFAANLENALEYAIVRAMNSERTSKLLGHDKPLGTFRNKILMGYVMKLFGDETYLNLEALRCIRNAFAHSKIPISFETPEVAAAVAVMKIQELRPPVATPADGSAKDKPPPQKPREFFQEACESMHHNLFVLNMSGPLRIDPNALELSLHPIYEEVFALERPLP